MQRHTAAACERYFIEHIHLTLLRVLRTAKVLLRVLSAVIFKGMIKCEYLLGLSTNWINTDVHLFEVLIQSNWVCVSNRSVESGETKETLCQAALCVSAETSCGGMSHSSRVV